MNTNPLQQFRDTVYQALPKRADATMDLLDALTSSLQVTAPVALSESPLFRRGFAAVYDALAVCTKTPGPNRRSQRGALEFMGQC